MNPAQRVVEALGGRWTGNRSSCRCPAHDDHKPSLSVSYENGKVLVKCHTGCEQKDVIAALKRQGLWPQTERVRIDRDRDAGRQIHLSGVHDDERQRQQRAEDILDAAHRSGKRPKRYLRGRGIKRCPRTAMLLPATDTARLTGSPGPRYPAMVFAVIKDDEEVAAHVTFLNRAADGKLNTNPSKKLYGAARGGYIELAEPAPDQPLIVGEGAETVLSAMQIVGLPGISALSATNMETVEVPPCAGVIIAADPDGRGVDSANKLARRLVAQDIAARIALPPDGFEDWNDALLRCDIPEQELRKLIVEAPDWQDDGSGLLEDLAALGSIEYDQRREEAAKQLGIRVGTLDKEVAERKEHRSVGGFLQPPEPWPEEVDGAELLDAIHDTITDHVVLGKHAYVAIALWIMHAHVHDAATHSPILTLSSPTKRCGKTTAMIVLNSLVPKPLPSANVTTATMFRAIERWKPTLLIDEADAFIREHNDLRGVIDSGHERTQAFVLRCVGDDLVPMQFSTWAPKVIAIIGRMHPTLEDRSIRIEMRRKLASKTVKKVPKNREHFTELCRRAARWAADHFDALSAAEPDMPKLHDRAADNWYALIAIADEAGGDWPELAREAAVKLSGVDDDETPAIQLLSDIRALLRDDDAWPSELLATELAGMEDRPWPAFSKGGPITAHAVARLLKPFGVKPRKITRNGRQVQGYRAQQFARVFERYLPQEAEQGEEKQSSLIPLSSRKSKR